MKIAIVTPHFDESLHVLNRCVRSVAQQEGPDSVTQFLVSDGSPLDRHIFAGAIDGVRPLELGASHDDTGNTARACGAICAMAEGFDAIGFLDADNWLEPDHCNMMARLALRPSVDARVPLPGVVVAQRILHRPDGSSMHVDRDDSNGTDHADTNCLFVMRSAFYVLPLWGALPPGWEKAGDQVIGPSSALAQRCAAP